MVSILQKCLNEARRIVEKTGFPHRTTLRGPDLRESVQLKIWNMLVKPEGYVPLTFYNYYNMVKSKDNRFGINSPVAHILIHHT